MSNPQHPLSCTSSTNLAFKKNASLPVWMVKDTKDMDFCTAGSKFSKENTNWEHKNSPEHSSQSPLLVAQKPRVHIRNRYRTSNSSVTTKIEVSWKRKCAQNRSDHAAAKQSKLSVTTQPLAHGRHNHVLPSSGPVQTGTSTTSGQKGKQSH